MNLNSFGRKETYLVKSKGLPVIRTKMMIPAMRARMVHRQRLIDRIEQGLPQGLVLVSAPAGYGKTTLVAEWARQSQKPVGWISLDPQDNDLQVFNRYLTSFVEVFFPNLPLSGMPLTGDSEGEFQALLVEIINACSELDQEFTMVLDDYHVIQNSQIHDGLLFTLEHLPQQLHFIVITRSDPPFPLARLRANGHVCEVKAADLSFSPAEASEFLTQTMQLHIDEAQTRQLNHEAEGWIAGLQMAALAHREALGRSPTADNQSLIQQYLIEEVFAHQPPELQEFLLRTSILNNLSGPLCNYLLGDQPGKPSGNQLLQKVNRSNLFITALDNEGKWFRFHPLFAEALRNLLAEKYPAEIPALHVRISKWCDHNDMSIEALQHALAGKDYQLTLSLLEKYSLQAMTQGNILDLLQWIEKVPIELIENSPLLCLIYSWGLVLSFDLDSSAKWVEKASRLLAEDKVQVKTDLSQQLRGGILAVQSILAAAHGEGERAIELSKQALELLPEENSFAHCFALLDQGVTYSLNGELSRAASLLEETISVSRSTGNWMVMMIARSNLGDLLISRGELNQALTLYRQSLAFAAPANGANSGFEGLFYIEIGEVYLLRNQLTEAEEALHSGLKLSSSWLPRLYELDATLQLARLQHSRGNYADSVATLQRAHALADVSEDSLDNLLVEIQTAKLALLRGETQPALVWASQNHLMEDAPPDWLTKVPFSFDISIHLLLARLFLRLASTEKNPQSVQRCRSLLAELLPRLYATEDVLSQIEANLLLALALQSVDETDDALAALEKALALAEPEGIRQVFVDEGLPLSRLLTRYLAYLKRRKESPIMPTRAFVTDLLFRISTPAETSAAITAVEPAPQVDLLTLRELEVLGQVAQGRTNQEIAAGLHLSVNTVKRHLNNIFLKLGATTRIQAIAVARQHGWLE